jgi:WD40 repeat protein
VARLEGHSQHVGALTFHPDGSLLASHGWDGMMFLWDPATGRQLMRFAEARMPRFSPDGRWLGAAWHGDSAELLEVIPSREYRTLANSTGRGRHAYDQGDISPDGRLLVVGMWDCAVLWDLCSGRELARLPQRTPYVSFEAEPARQGEPKPQDVAQRAACAIRALLTSGPGGLLRWPVQADEPLASSAGAEGSVKQAQCLRLGPPQQLSSLQRAWFARSTDGGTLAVATEEGGANKLLDSETGAVRRELGIHPSGEVRALSADGRWAASSGWHSDRVRLWNARSGELIHEWTIDKRNYVFFTPDSRTLIIARGDEFSFWDVETFQPIRRLRRDIAHHPGHVAFSPDGKLMALEMDPASIHLKDAATGRTIAKLEDPHGDRSTWLGFTPDGAQLVAASTYASAVHVWDLRAIRARLKEMKLDWDWPEFLPAAPGKTAVETVTIAIDRGDGAVDKKKNCQPLMLFLLGTALAAAFAVRASG